MNQSNTKVGAIVGLLTVIITQFFLRALGVNTISTIIYVTLILVLGIVVAVSIMVSKNKKLGKKNSIIAAILMLSMSISNTLAMILIRCYPEFGDEHKLAAMAILSSAFITFIAVVVFWAIIGTKMSRNN